MKPIFQYEFFHTYYLSSFSKEGVFPQKIKLANGTIIDWNSLLYDKDGEYLAMGIGAEQHKSCSGGSVNPTERLTSVLNIFDAAVLQVEVEAEYLDSYHVSPPEKKHFTVVIEETDGVISAQKK